MMLAASALILSSCNREEDWRTVAPQVNFETASYAVELAEDDVDIDVSLLLSTPSQEDLPNLI